METGRWDIFRMGIAAANWPELMVPDGIFPAWSPDGQHFAFTTYRTGDMELFLADQTGKNFRNLTNHPAYDARATWSPDGRRLADPQGQPHPRSRNHEGQGDRKAHDHHCDAPPADHRASRNRRAGVIVGQTVNG